MTGKVEEMANGVEVYRATDEEDDVCNIYCEHCFAARDAHCFVYQRHLTGADGLVKQYVACDFGTWETHVIGETSVGSACTMANNGTFYYLREAQHGRQELVSVNLMTDERQTISLPEGFPVGRGLSVAAGERYLAYGTVLSWAPPLFAIDLVDLRSGSIARLHEDPYICNPHHQFEPGEGRWLMVQHNRGCAFTPGGECLALVGDEGATIFFVEVPGGRVVRPAVGPPYTDGASGHETWMGTTGEVILTLNTQRDYDHGKGGILGVRPDGGVREICSPWQSNHIGMDLGGRLFAADAYSPDGIIVGCPATNKAVVVAPARTRYTRAGDEGGTVDHHPHAYMSPDLKWVVFNSDRAGTQQVYVARLPDEMVEDLQRKG